MNFNVFSIWLILLVALVDSGSASKYLINMACPKASYPPGYRTVDIYYTTTCREMPGDNWYSASCEDGKAIVNEFCDDFTCQHDCSKESMNKTTGCNSGESIGAFCSDSYPDLPKLLNTTEFFRVIAFYDENCEEPAFETVTAANLCLRDGDTKNYERAICTSDGSQTQIIYEQYWDNPTCLGAVHNPQVYGPWPSNSCTKMFPDSVTYTLVECYY